MGVLLVSVPVALRTDRAEWQPAFSCKAVDVGKLSLKLRTRPGLEVWKEQTVRVLLLMIASCGLRACRSRSILIRRVPILRHLLMSMRLHSLFSEWLMRLLCRVRC